MRYWPLFSLGLLAVILILRPAPTWAAASCGSSTTTTTTTTTSATTSTTGEAAAADYVPGPESAYSLEQPFAGEDSVKNIGEYIQLVYRFALGIVGIIAVVLIMFGGLRWMAAAGNESIITEAKEIVTSAVTGLVIALLSYVILAFINPQTLDLSVSVFKIPKPPVTSCPNPPVLVPVNDVDGLDGNGATACQGAITALQQVAATMRADCTTCTIHVGSAYRSPESQAGMYACYQSCVDQGYISSNGLTHCKEGAPGGSCTNCVKTAAPCDSNHTKGLAFDLYFDGYSLGEAPAKYAGVQSKNNGGLGGTVNYNQTCSGSCDAGLFAAQKQLYNIMTSGDFTNYSAEWWHFDYTGKCGVAETACLTGTTAADGTKTSAEGYCQAVSGSDKFYHYAICNAGTPATCGTWGDLTWYYVVPGSCTSAGEITRWYTFDDDDLASSDASLGIYTELPFCNTSGAAS
ncbi:MAG: hypothetical protein HY565_02750 [Candidatus Kerfeldbacteria bacterium]|nr:hypothetical protein [Candidatus Kerfeldbacteria bacterium]